MQANSTTELLMFLSPLVRLRIARRRLLLCWRESEYLQPFVVAAAILIVVFAPMAVIVWRSWR